MREGGAAVRKEEHGKGMDLARVPAEKARLHRILCYRDPVPERNAELKDITTSTYGWEKVFHYYGFRLEENPGRMPTVRKISEGTEVGYKTAAEQILLDAAARYGVANRIVHRIRGGALTTDHGSVYQTDGHNLNPLSIKDYDVIWFSEDYEGFLKNKSLTEIKGITESQGGREGTTQRYQNGDNNTALTQIRELARKLELEDMQHKAESVYNEIYHMAV